MRWIIGLDIRPSSQGAIRFATWLRAQSTDPTPPDLVGVHVLEHDYMMMALRRRHLDEVVSAATKAAHEAVEAVGAAEHVAPIAVVRAMTAEESLAGAIAMHGADGVIIGRQAGRDELAIVRLGRVARRLLRTLPGPVVVTPPDLLPSHLGVGPIVCAVRPRPDAHRAVTFARKLAADLDRSLLLLHVVRVPGLDGLVLDKDSHAQILREVVDDAQAQLRAWLDANAMSELRSEVITGSIAATIRERAKALGSPLIVCGSRRLPSFERVYRSSVATDLASGCAIPVMVVPPISR